MFDNIPNLSEDDAFKVHRARIDAIIARIKEVFARQEAEGKVPCLCGEDLNLPEVTKQ